MRDSEIGTAVVCAPSDALVQLEKKYGAAYLAEADGY
jgi:hypothetical protein